MVGVDSRVKHPPTDTLPDTVTAILDRIEEARWWNLEDVDIAISDGLATIPTLGLEQALQERATAILLLARCLNSLRRISRLDQREVLIVEDARERFASDPIVSILLWVIDNSRTFSRDTAQEYIDHGHTAAALGAFWLSDQLYEGGFRAMAQGNNLEAIRAVQQELLSRPLGAHLKLLMPIVISNERLGVDDNDPSFVEDIQSLTEAVEEIPRLRTMMYVARAFLAGTIGETDQSAALIEAMTGEAEAYGSSSWLITTLMNANSLSRNRGDLLTAIRYGQKARTLAREMDLRRSWAQVDHSLAWSYDEVGLPEISVTVGHEGLNLALENGQTELAFDLYLILGKSYSRLNQIEDAIEIFDKAFDLADQVRDQILRRIEVLTFKGHALTRANRAEEALPGLTEALDVCQQHLAKLSEPDLTWSLQLANVRWALARTHHLLKEFDKAIPHYEGLRSREQQFVNSDEGVDIHRHIAECYTAIGDEARALRSYQQYIEAHQEFRSAEQQQRIVRQEVERSVEAERLRAERERQLLHAILPSAIADRRLNGERRIADTIEDVVVVFIDVAGFTPKAERLTAHQLIRYLEGVFDPIESIITKHGGEKIKTIGDAFMAACGATADTDRRAERMVRAALEIAELHGSDIRIGINSGQVVAGVLGEGRFTFDLWGDAVNTAARMEEFGEPGLVHVTEAIARQIDGITDLRVESRGTIDVKGKGLMQTYWVKRA